MAPKTKRVHLGTVSVDSGQILICDPCYIGTEWQNKDFTPKNQLKDTQLNIFIEGPRKLGKRYDEIYRDGLTYNEAISKGILIEISEEATGDFSYDGCSKTTLDRPGGQLKFQAGHIGVGVASQSGFGDGSYNVFATIDQDSGRVKKVEIIFF